MPRPRNLWEVLAQTADVVPGAMEAQTAGKNKAKLADLQMMLKQGQQANWQASFDQREEFKRQSMMARNEQELYDRQQIGMEREYEDILQRRKQPMEDAKLIEQNLKNKALLKALGGTTDSDKATKALIDKLVGSRGTKTKTVRGIESIEPAGTGFLGTGIFAAKPETTFVDQRVPIGAEELEAFMDSLSQRFGITPDTTQGFDFDQIADPTSDVLGRPFETDEQKYKRLKAKYAPVQ